MCEKNNLRCEDRPIALTPLPRPVYFWGGHGGTQNEYKLSGTNGGT